MTPEKFKIVINDANGKFMKAINIDLPLVIGKKAVDLFRENFRLEGFQDKNSVEKWKEVNRREKRTTRASSNRKILTGDTGDLGRSIIFESNNAGVITVYSDLVYAPVHNNGLRAGRGEGFQMPKRQFIGSSSYLDQIIETEIDRVINNLF